MRVLRLLAVGLLLAACESSDVGKPCPELLSGQDPGSSGDGRSESLEVVEQNVQFPCDELICIATSGRSGYCSKKCRDDSVCPDGFECRVVQDVGPFAGESFCAWKPCNKRGDCGDKNSFCCVKTPGSDPVEDAKYCDFSDGEGSCG